MGNSASTVMGRDKLPDLPIVGNQRKWNVAKVVLRCISLFLSIVDVGELIAIETGRNGLDYWPSVAYPVLSGFILWDVIEFVVILVRGKISKGIHPGFHVGVELILWLGSVLTVAAQGYRADWGQLAGSESYLEERDLAIWARVALTQFIFLSVLLFLRFVFFVRACIEVDRRKKDRRLQQLVIAIQKQGRDPQDIPLAALRAVRETNEITSSTVLHALSTATRSTTQSSSTAVSPTPTPTQSQSHHPPPLQSRASAMGTTPAEDDRDFAYKYNFHIATVPELLQSGIHPEDARNQKVLIGAFPR